MQNPRLELRSFDLDLDSYERILWREAHREHQRMIIIVAAIGGLFACFTAWQLYSSSSLNPLWKAGPLFLFWGWWYWWFFRRVPFSIARNPLNRFQLGTHEITIADGLIHVRKSSGSSATLPLSQVVKVSKQDQHYLLYENSFSAIPIPRSAFGSRADEAEFERQLAQAMSETAA